MSTPARLKAHLEQAHAGYIRVPHIPARSSQYAASLLDVPGEKVAKSVARRKPSLACDTPGFLSCRPEKVGQYSWLVSEVH